MTVRAAGIIFRDEGKILFCMRGAKGPHAGTWAFPGGKVEEGETPEQAAVRECQEELGFCPDGDRQEFARYKSDDLDFTAYVQPCSEFVPTLNEENVGYCWAGPGEYPHPMHPVSKNIVDKFTMNEYELAQAIRDGKLSSPVHCKNMWLFDLRITGTGMAHRPALNEHVFRDPEHYLTEKFVARCNGLPVILDHPSEQFLNSKEFSDRIVGTVVLPYIREDEVRGVAKIYDDTTAEIMRTIQVSTSPTVMLSKDGNHREDLQDGSVLLVEGSPDLLDHLALCLRGVWDKGGEPCGVTTTLKEEPTMTLKSDSVADTDEATKARSDADTEDALDTILATLRSMNSRMDSIEEGQMAPPRSDESGDDDGDCAESHDTDSNGDAPGGEDEPAGGDDSDGEDENMGLKMAAKRKEEEEAQSRSDSIAAANRREVDRLRRQVAQLSSRMPRQMTDEEYAEMASAQSRADSVASAFGRTASRPLQGESLLGYRRRLAGDYKSHSKDYKDVDLASISDPKLFDIVEKRIYADALEVAMSPASAPEGGLREITRRDHTGRNVSTFVGSVDSWLGDFKVRPQGVRLNTRGRGNN